MQLEDQRIIMTPPRIRLSCCNLFLLAAVLHAQTPNHTEVYDPVADPKAIVTVGHARFTVLTPQMIRMEWAVDGKFEDHASLVFLDRHLPVPQFTTTRRGDGVEIRTAALDLKYNPVGPGRFDAQNLSVSLTLPSGPVTWHPGDLAGGNLMGTTRTLDGALGGKTREPIGPGLISRDGWAVVDDSARPLFDSTDFSFQEGEKSAWPWVMERSPGDRQDWYFFGYGHDYKAALGDFVRVAGRIPLPPRFAFGAWWSRYWAYSDQELDELVKGFRENDVPLDVFVIDMDWHNTFNEKRSTHAVDQAGQTLGWTGYTWNSLLFPDPAEFLKGLHDNGLKVTLNLHPAGGVQPFEDAYPAMAKAMGQDPADKKYVPFDITNKTFARNYFDILHHPIEKQGVDFWWLDWQQGETTAIKGVNPTWWLNYTHFTDQAREGKRPLLFHRWGGLGNHRYEIGFSGDTVSVWESLAFQPGFTAQAANVGYAYWSHDIGGHMPGVVEPELYLRWLQFGAFSPILRTHTTKNADSERRVWAYPEPYSGLMREAIQRRYAMVPYLYTEGRRTYDTGVAFLHPLYFDWPEAPEAYQHSNEYVFGDSMLVAPITSPSEPGSQQSGQSVWLPGGEWFEVDTGRMLHGDQTVTQAFTLSEIPMYERAGAIVPMQPPMQYTGEKPVDPLIVSVAPRASDGSTHYTLYEDGSDGRAYQVGEFARTRIDATQQGSTSRITIAAANGSYPGKPTERAYEVRLPGYWPPVRVSVNGKPLPWNLDVSRKDAATGWTYEGNSLTTIVRTPRFRAGTSVEIVVEHDPRLVKRWLELSGFAGAMTRLRDTYDPLNRTWPAGRSPDSLIDVMQTGDRLHYHPERAGEELRHLREVLPTAQADVKAMGDSLTIAVQDRKTNQANSAGHSNPQRDKRAQDLDDSRSRAMDQMQSAANILSSPSSAASQ
jgi:alpha-glucosidase (family GH31 glycosyl hydrolase)